MDKIFGATSVSTTADNTPYLLFVKKIAMALTDWGLLNFIIV